MSLRREGSGEGAPSSGAEDREAEKQPLSLSPSLSAAISISLPACHSALRKTHTWLGQLTMVSWKACDAAMSFFFQKEEKSIDGCSTPTTNASFLGSLSATAAARPCVRSRLCNREGRDHAPRQGHKRASSRKTRETGKRFRHEKCAKKKFFFLSSFSLSSLSHLDLLFSALSLCLSLSRSLAPFTLK